MKITLNKKEKDVADGMLLGELLVSEGIGGAGIAVAVDNKVVRRADRDAFVLHEGADIVVIKAVCGG